MEWAAGGGNFLNSWGARFARVCLSAGCVCLLSDTFLVLVMSPSTHMTYFGIFFYNALSNWVVSGIQKGRQQTVGQTYYISYQHSD